MAEHKRFPEIQPSSRQYRPGRLPETIFEAQNGATTFVQFGNQFVNAEMSMTFKNIANDKAAEIVNHYRSVTENDWVLFDGEHGLMGLGTNLYNAFDKGEDKLRWRYDGPPQVTGVIPGVSTVSCKFIGFFYGA